MRHLSRRLARTGAVAAVTAFALAGCGSNDLESPTAAKLRALANFYLDYAVAKNGGGPANEQVLKKHMRGLPDFILQSNGVDPAAIDAVFSSERDREPFVVVYGTMITRISGTSAPLVAHEKTGKNGKRLVVYANAKVDLVDEARLQELSARKQ
jgi:hypothetical protein